MTLDYDKRIPERGYKKNNLNNEEFDPGSG